MRSRIASVFEARRFQAPRQDRFHLPPQVLRTLVEAYVQKGFHELMPRTRDYPGVVREVPNIHYDTLDGSACFAKWVRLRLVSGDWVMLPISYVAPVFSATNALYSHSGSRAIDDVRPWSRTAMIAELIEVAQSALKPLGFDYLDWNAPALDEPIPMRDLPDATARDLIFNYEPYE